MINSVFILTEEKQRSYEQLKEKSALLFDSLDHRISHLPFIHTLIRDIWSVFVHPHEKLFMSPEAILHYPIRVTVAESIMKSDALSKFKYKLIDQYILALTCAIEVLNDIVKRVFANYTLEHPCVAYLLKFASFDVGELFNNAANKNYPLDLATAQAHASKSYRLELFNGQEDLNDMVENAIRRGLLAYENNTTVATRRK